MDALVNYTLITNEISLINHHMVGESYTVNPQIHRDISVLEDNKRAVTYVLEIKNLFIEKKIMNVNFRIFSYIYYRNNINYL